MMMWVGPLISRKRSILLNITKQYKAAFFVRCINEHYLWLYSYLLEKFTINTVWQIFYNVNKNVKLNVLLNKNLFLYLRNI